MAAAEKTPTTAEGHVIPVPESAGPPPAPPTEDEYRYEHGSYQATQDLYVGTGLAVNAGGSVGASHPYRKQWQRDGMAVYVGAENGLGKEQDPPGKE